MVTRPAVHPPSTTVADLRTYFDDHHLHMILLAEGDRVIGTVERADLTPNLGRELPASTISTLEERTIRPDAPLASALDLMTRAGRRRLAVTSDGYTLLGLLCLKASGDGFCSDADVADRRSSTS